MDVLDVSDNYSTSEARCFVICGRHFKTTQLRDGHITAVRTKSTKKKGANRQGAKVVKKLERVRSSGGLNRLKLLCFAHSQLAQIFGTQ